MAETLLQYQHPVMAPDGTLYEARACGGPMPGGMWHGWIRVRPARRRRAGAVAARDDAAQPGRYRILGDRRVAGLSRGSAAAAP